MADRLLMDWDDRLAWPRSVGVVTATEILRGDEDTQLTVVLAESPARPPKTDLREMLRQRATGGVPPVIIAVTYPGGAGPVVVLLGLDDEAVPLYDLEVGLSEQLLSDALQATSPSGLHADVSRRLAALYSTVASGLRNEGLFALHALKQKPEEANWSDRCVQAAPLLKARGGGLLGGLGYTLETLPDGTVLREAAGGQRRAAAVLLAEGESFENPLTRLRNTNAVTHGLHLARQEQLDWLVVSGGRVIRLYPVNPDVGIGRKGETQTYVELDLSLLRAPEAGFLTLLFSPDALLAGGTVASLLSESIKYATGLSERLRDRIYVKVVPRLSKAVADRRNITSQPAEVQKEALAEAYHQAMILLFRLLFVAYGEDRGLLPYGVSDQYTRNALKTLALDFAKDPDKSFSAASTAYWDDLTQVWKVIDTGDVEGWGVPAYNGGLFTRDASKNASGAATYDLDLTNDQIGPVLRDLLVDRDGDEPLGPVDFRSLSVREFGTIYEGLLESGLGVAEADLTIDAEETFVPASSGDPVAVAAGEVYFHSRSGSRKATGSYFTKPFAVEHLLDSALAPALDDHLRRVSRLVEAGATKMAAEALFDFRVVDLSMGSAHFLVAAVDRIEAKFSGFLHQHPLPEVSLELHDLRLAAAQQLGLDPADLEVDDGVLLRRQIARRCIYGADINEIAVELARLGVWIQTFVPGLPLSFLNHALIYGNSLTGVGTLHEITEALAEAEQRELKKLNSSQTTGLDEALQSFLDRAAEHLESLAALSDASIGDVATSGQIQIDLERALEPLAALCDLITAERATRHFRNGDPKKIRISEASGIFTALSADDLETAVLKHPKLDAIRGIARAVMAAHLPVRFPEVFRRDRPGFDCILGNPPWEKLKVEEHSWWALRSPGLRSLAQHAKNARVTELTEQRPDLQEEYQAEATAVKAAANILAAGPFPGLRNATDTDLFAAFCWRFWHEVRDGGRVGVVLPRTALAGGGTEQWRKRILAEGTFTDITLLTNNRGWAFEQIHPQWTIGLVTIRKGGADRTVSLRGPYASAEDYALGLGDPDGQAVVPAATISTWSDAAVIPLIPSRDVPVFTVLRSHPALVADVGPWKVQPIRELHSTDNKHMFDFDLPQPQQGHTLPVLAGGSFNLWKPDFGPPYAYADPAVVEAFLQSRRARSAASKGTAWTGKAAKQLNDPKSLPLHHSRIAFRDVARATDTRTMICALLPPDVTTVHVAPYILQQRGDDRDVAYLLGVLSSVPLDWYARKFVEQHMTYEHLNAFPVPRVDPDSGQLLGVAGYEHPYAGKDVRILRDRVVDIAGRLAAVDHRYTNWAAAVGVPVGSVATPAAADELHAELDAAVSLLYGLDADNLSALFASFHRGWAYANRLSAVLRHRACLAAHMEDEA